MQAAVFACLCAAPCAAKLVAMVMKGLGLRPPSTIHVPGAAGCVCSVVLGRHACRACACTCARVCVCVCACVCACASWCTACSLGGPAPPLCAQASAALRLLPGHQEQPVPMPLLHPAVGHAQRLQEDEEDQEDDGVR